MNTNYDRKRGFDFGDFEITWREIIASITIIAVMLLIGVQISSSISEHQADKNEMYDKAAKIESSELFQHGMNTNLGDAFIYGSLEAVDTVTFPEIGGEYMYIVKIEERKERHERKVKKKDDDGKEHEVKEVYYEWEEYDRESLHCNELSFCGIVFPYDKIDIPGTSYITEQSGGKTYSWKSGERVKVRYKYYGVDISFVGTLFTTLKDGTISDNSDFYANRTIEETVERLESGSGTVIFWIFWIMLTGAAVFGFCYLDNKWLE